MKKLTDGGAQGALVTAVSPKAFQQALGMMSRGGTIAFYGLPAGEFPVSIFDKMRKGEIEGRIVMDMTK